MEKLYILLLLMIGFFGNALIVNIPDANFKVSFFECEQISLGFNTNAFVLMRSL
jgi:hypothetical protein